MNPKRWTLNVLKWLDIGVNVVFLCSSKVETLSRRSARARADGKRWGCILCGVLDAIAKDHCAKALRAGESF